MAELTQAASQPDDNDYTRLLADNGPLAQALTNFLPRAGQQRMAEAIGQVLESRGRLVVEAGTGIGKTYAYLAPALHWGGKVLISTATRTLQEQIFHRDLPTVQRALGQPVSAALLKGRSNYLCLYRLELISALAHTTPADHRFRKQVEDWSAVTRSGDIAELKNIPANASLWPQVTSTTDNCLGGECPKLNDCFVLRARRQAQDARVVVVNHHLLFADLALRQEGFGELLPGADAVILDEAHQIPEIASQFFGIALTGRQIFDLCRDVIAEHDRELRDMPELTDAAWAVESQLRQTRDAFGADEQRKSWMDWSNRLGMADSMATFQSTLSHLLTRLNLAAERTTGLANCARRAEELVARLQQFLQSDDDEAVRWAETSRQSFTLHITPLTVAPSMSAFLDRRCAWIFTSATLAVDGQFNHFTHQLGLEEAATLQLESPFDYQRSALIYLPKGLPSPADADYTRKVVEAALPVIEASGGGAFMLFTSHRALQEAATLLANKLSHPLLVQGQRPPAELLARFRDEGHAVLLGTGSFWEGVDVPGPALRLVIIDRLPFASPSDPVLSAKLNAMAKAGEQPFMMYQVPQAVLNLKQGVGRLIRSVHDRGVLMICDPRLQRSSYGKVFLASLPPAPVTRDLASVVSFYASPENHGMSAK